MDYHDNNGVYHAFRAAILLSLFDFRIATSGDVGDTTANGGLPSSNTAPALSGTSTGISQQLSWATGSTAAILTQIALPEDFDGRDDVLVELWVNSGTTDDASFTVNTSWNGGTTVADAATDDAPSATTHKIVARIAAADIPDGAAYVSLELVPAAHATNAIQLIAARMLYTPRVN